MFFKNIILLFSVLFVNFCSLGAEEYKVVGYYPNWAIYRTPAFYPKDIDASLLTHINYAFLKSDVQGNVELIDPWADTDHRSNWNIEKPYWGNFRQLKELKEKNPHLKTLISIGGWTLSDSFSEMAANSKARANFVKQCISYCERYDFDGVDIDWEFPGFAAHSGRPEDKENYTQLLKELYAAAKAHKPKLLVTIAAPASPLHYKHLELDKIHHYLDWINLMSYDFHGPWGGDEDSLTNHHSALYPTRFGNPLFCTDTAINYYLDRGVPAKKIVLGMPLYGRSYAGVNGAANGLESPFKGVGEGTTDEAGLRFFSDIKQNLLSHYTRYWDSEAQVPFLYNEKTHEFITYEDEESLGIKCHYVREKNLGGAMVWELGLDTIPSWDCMKTIKQHLNP